VLISHAAHAGAGRQKSTCHFATLLARPRPRDSSDSKDHHNLIKKRRLSIRLEHSIDDERGKYGAFTAVTVDVLLRSTKIGSIEATIINRQKVPDRFFLLACDGHSQSMQYVGLAVYEAKHGRTKLSLTGYDDPEFLGHLTLLTSELATS
jgi:hypothetical protein